MAPPKALMFINKTSESQSLSRSVGRERRQIFSHVQPGSSKNAANPAFQKWVIDHDNSESSIDTHGPGASNQVPTQVTDAVFAADSSAQMRWVQEFRVPQTPSIPRALDFDPEVLVDLDELAKSYMAKVPEFFQSLFAQHLFPSQPIAASALTYTLSLTAQSLAARNALLCAVASTMSLMSGLAFFKEHSVYLKGVSLYRLRRQVCYDTDQLGPSPTLCAISMLLWTECLQGNIEHVVAHVSGLQQVLGYVKIGEQLLLSEAVAVFSTSNLCSAMLRTPPLPPPVSSKNYAIRADVDEYVLCELNHSFEHLASGFFEAGNAQIVGSKLLDLAARQKARCAFREFGRFEGMTAEHPDNEGLACEAMAVDYELLTAAQVDNGSGLTHAQDAIRLCLFLVTQPILGLMGPTSALGRSMANQLCNALERSDVDGMWAPNFDLLLWVLFITAYHSEQGARWLWLTEKIRRLFGTLQVDSKEEFEEILKRFIFVKDLYGGMLSKVWSEAHTMLACDDITCPEHWGLC